EAIGQVGKNGVFLLYGLDRFAGRDAGQAPHALGDPLLADDFEVTCLAGVLQMRPAAKFAAEAVADFHNTHDIAVFIAEEGAHAGHLPGLGDRQLTPSYRQVLINALIDKALDLAFFSFRPRP